MGGLNISHLHGADIVSRLRELMSRNRLKANTASISDETRRALDNEYQKLERELELHTLHTASGGVITTALSVIIALLIMLYHNEINSLRWFSIALSSR